MNLKAAESKLINGFLEGRRENYSIIEKWISSVLVLPGWHGSIIAARDDIQQQVLIILTENFRAGKYRGLGLKTYVSRITKFTCLKVYDRSEPTESLVTEPESGNPSPVEEILTGERWAVLRKVISELEYRCRRILALRYYKNLDHKEIAEKLKTTPGASRQWLKRCLDKARILANKLENL